MTSRPSIRTQILIFTLFGEYIALYGGSVWTGSLLRLLGALGVSERATRSTLSRMSQKGWLTSKRERRYSRYALSPRGWRIVRGGEVRIFEPRRTQWDGLWHMVVYSIPEGRRRLRSRLRTRLGWLGFGRLAPGTWISPNNRKAEVEAELDDLGVRPYAVYFSGMKLNFASNEEIVRRCWDMNRLNRDYLSFVKRYKPAFERLQAILEDGRPLSPAECFRERFWLTLEYSQFPRRDPNLPPALQPQGWVGSSASDMFLAFHGLLREPSERFVAEMLNQPAYEPLQA